MLSFLKRQTRLAPIKRYFFVIYKNSNDQVHRCKA
ncbi:hypothetical protein M2354_000896 [Leclercia adecarboxylata]|nr:hypothetical protein [Leclercia adecarboxylata]